MSFLSPFTALVAAGIFVPLLVLLYVLRLRRMPLRIASTMLWRQSHHDLEANVPFRRLRASLLFLLQLIAALFLLAALAQPRILGEVAGAERIILLIDRSASMSATDAGPDDATRLDAAKEQALRIIDRLGARSEPSQLMVIAFGASAGVVQGFETHEPTLRAAVEAIEPTDEPANLDAALQVAGAFATRRDEADQAPPEVILISDGGAGHRRDGDSFRLRGGQFRFVQVGPAPGAPVENLGIAAFSARRDYEDPARVLVFARLVNVAPHEVQTTLTLRADQETIAIERVTVPAAPADAAGAPGEAPVSFTLDQPAGAVLTLRHEHEDSLAADDTAALVLPAPSRQRIAIVHPAEGVDPFLADLVAALEPGPVRRLSEEAFALLDPSEVDGGALLDLIIFDRVSADRLPGVPSLTIGGVPAPVRAVEPKGPGGRRVLSWDRRHPVMRHVSLDALIFSGFGAYDLPAGATTLALGPEGPVIALIAAHGAEHVLVGFDLVRSNWPVHLSSVVFLRNVVDHLTLAGSGQTALVSRPGEPVSVRVKAGVRELGIEGPVSGRLEVESGRSVTLPRLRRCGLYAVEGAVPPADRVAVSLLTEQESDLRSRSSVTVNAQAAVAGRANRVAPVELWPWLAGLGLAMLLLEWLVYLRRVRGW